jgi:ParB-like chromosome segregation protein Spo0J
MTVEWPADKVERRPIDALIPYARNARTHSEEQVAQIAASIREWGWTVPVLVDEAGGIIAGHGRVMAARKLGLAEVPVMVAAGWSEAQKRAYVLADNKLALNAGWDYGFLAQELADLQEIDFNIALTGFDELFVASLLTDGEAVSEPLNEMEGTGNEPLAARTIHVHFESESDAFEFAKRLGCNITEKTKTIWFPPK